MASTENLAPHIITRVMREIRDLVKNPLDGIQYEENEDNSVAEIHAVLSGPEGTPFVGGRFRLKLVLSSEYPMAPPKGYFLTRIYHPNVSNSGDICVNTLKKDWTADLTLKHVLQVIRCLLIVPFPESSLNDEAGKLFMESYEEFARRARIMTQVHAMSEGAAGAETTTAVAGGKVGGNSMCIDADSEESEIDKQKQKAIKDAKKKSLKRL